MTDDADESLPERAPAEVKPRKTVDWLEQVPRSQEWDYRRPAYRRMAERLGQRAVENYEHIYGQEAR